MDSKGFYASPRTHYGNGAANSGDAFGALGQDTMQQAQKNNAGAAFGPRMDQSMIQPSQTTGANVVFDPATGQNLMQQSRTTNAGVAFGARMGKMVMQQSQITNVGQFDSSRPNRMLQLQDPQQQQRSNALPEKGRGSPAKAASEVEACVKRVTEYTLRLRNRRQDNSIAFWKKFVGQFYALDAKKRLCVSMYDARKIAGVFPQESWHCEICNRKPGHGLEANAEILPRLFKIKFESGALDEFMYIDMPHGYHNSSGQIILEYGKAIQESIFDQLRVVREGQLRVVFSPELKFCARRHEELVPQRLLVPQIGTLGFAAQMYRAATAATLSSSSSASHIHSSSNMLADSAAHLADTFKTPLVNELGYSRRYVRSIQISEVVNSMKDLIDQFWVTGTGPIESLSKYSRRSTKGPLSGEPSIQNSNKKKPLDFPPAAFQLMCNSIMNSYRASSASTSTNAAQFISHRGTTLLRSRGPRNSTNSPSAITYGPSTPSSSMPPPRNMNTATSTADAILYGQSNGSGGAMDVGSFGTGTIFVDDDLLPSGSNMYAPSGLFQNDARDTNPISVFGGVGSSKGKATFQGEESSSAIGPNLIPMDGKCRNVFNGPGSAHRPSAAAARYGRSPLG